MVANLSNERGGRRRGRPERSPPGAQRFGPLPIDNPLPPIEVLDVETLVRMINAAYRLIEEAGLEFRSERVLNLLKANGAILEDETKIARMGRDIVEHFVELAPRASSFMPATRNGRRILAATVSTSIQWGARRTFPISRAAGVPAPIRRSAIL
jgi:trimethylamine---corrinoid protein Co-methyltransferase